MDGSSNMRITMADWKVNRRQKKLVKQVLNSGRLTYGAKTKAFEEKFAQIHGAKYALFTSSGTAALKIALGVLKEENGWQDGDEIIIPSVTFVATMNAVVMNNLKPVLVDVDHYTANINPGFIYQAITKKTRAIIPVHLLGQPADMKRIKQIARKYKLKIVEDSCETMFVNKLEGDIACFSTYVAHLAVTGVGGVILTNNKKMATLMRSMMFHGRDESYLNMDDEPKDIFKKFHFPRFGYSDRMTEMEAALGLTDLENYQEMINKRQENARYLLENIAYTGPIADIEKHAFMFLPLYVPTRDGLMKYLSSKGIDTRTIMPLITQPVAEPYLTKDYHEAIFISNFGILLPCHQYLGKKELDYMIKCIKDFYEDS